MKISILFVVVFVAFAAAQETRREVHPPPFFPPFNPSQEGIFVDNLKNFGKKTLDGLKSLGKKVGKGLINVAAEMITDGLRLEAAQDVSAAFNGSVSTEAIFDQLGNLIEQRAKEELLSGFPGQEGIIHDLSPYYRYRIPNIEEYLRVHYNRSYHFDGPSHEGLLGNLGGLALKGLGELIGGTVGNVISGAGNVLGSLFYALPSQQGASQEGIVSKLGQAGVLTSSGELIVKGASKVAKTLLSGIFKPLSDLLHGTIFLSRGQFSNYPNLHAPGQEALAPVRSLIHHHNFSQANVCVDAAEQNLNQLFEVYAQNSSLCANVSYVQGLPIFEKVYDIILDAVTRVEESHLEASYCFEKIVPANRIKCLDEDVPALIAAHSKRFEEYGEHLSAFVKEFSNINTQFDVCLTGHLGVIRREVFGIINRFHSCVEQHEANAPVAAAAALAAV